MKLPGIVLAFVIALGALVWAQSATTGAIQGAVVDSKTSEKLAGVTVTVTSPALQSAQTAITDEAGFYKITGLPPGEYLVTFYYLDLTVERRGVIVAVNKTTPVYQKLDQSKSGGEVIRITASAPMIDPTSTKHGITIDQNYIKNIPVPGRTFQAVLGTAAGSQNDGGPSTESYSRIDDNTYQRSSAEPLSTFSIDVDTASYANTRRFLREGTLPPEDAVRIEELINYFPYDYPAPAQGGPFSITTEVGPSPWNGMHQLVRIGIATQAIADADVPPRNLVFLIDVSGSMEAENKLPLLVQAMNLLVDQLRPKDKIAIVVYAGASGLALPPTSGSDKRAIKTALAQLRAGGSTNGAAGIELAYKIAREELLPKGINRVILCTDGDFNVGTTSEGELTRLIETQRKGNVFLTVLGFGMGNLKDSTMEKLADRGNGNYAYIDSLDEAKKVLVKQAGATLVTVAKDVKIQVEFNPATVAGYRLIGYENRLLAAKDFNDDTKDAGEIGAGHSVTALYEIVPAGAAVPGAPKVDTLTYQKPAASTGARPDELMTVKVRYKAPTGDTSKLMTHVVHTARLQLSQTTNDFRFAAAVAGYGMLLRDSPFKGSLTWPQVAALARGALGADKGGYRKELVELVDLAAKTKRP
ncbi:MAG: von Willebrand factor type A domain-containing protein [Myxococcales bacterium]|nr:von Willebrand factor type A domain-containing protein [Myxococcales bacterium]